MARKPRSWQPDGYYHAMLRGVNRGLVFFDDGDRERFVMLLAEVAVRFEWRLVCYCLMANHVHVLMQSSREQLSLGMHRLSGLHAQATNVIHGRIGSFYQERFLSIPIEGPDHLVGLTGYIPSNPVRAGLCSDPAQWAWSSYRATVSANPAPPWLDRTWLEQWFGDESPDSPARTRRRYADFVSAYGAGTVPRAGPAYEGGCAA